jgi:hypothetical protein
VPPEHPRRGRLFFTMLFCGAVPATLFAVIACVSERHPMDRWPSFIAVGTLGHFVAFAVATLTTVFAAVASKPEGPRMTLPMLMAYMLLGAVAAFGLAIVAAHALAK